MTGFIYLIGAIQALFFAFLIIFKRIRHRAGRYLMLFFLLMALFLLFAYSNTHRFYEKLPMILPIIVLVPLLYGPALYAYMNVLSSEAPAP